MIKKYKKNYSIDEKKLYFAVFVLHAIAEKYKQTPSVIYKVLNKTNALNGYIFECYDMLHSMGKKAIVNDVEEYVKHRGMTFC